MHEFEIIKKYFLRLSKNINSLNLNDDVFFDRPRNLVVSVDTYVEGIHFINFKKPDLVIKKIIRSSLSDLICKGVRPKYYFISGSGNKKFFTKLNLRKISKSLKQEQKKFNVSLGGGDTVISNKLSFTIISLGFSKNIIYRNKAKENDDIYVTGNLGDSYTGLKILKKKIITNKYLSSYFEKKYYLPELYLNLSSKLLSFANCSIDLSDGLIADLEKMINQQNLSFIIYLDKIPISNNLKKLIYKKKLSKLGFISQGDDYQILFTADKSKSRIITKISKSLGIKISKIGKICSSSLKSHIIDEKGNKITPINKGYYHKF
tara:strand:+ start:3593 stop:4549 length:957 start_codon:yes stop_codon:yes gene_type:complete